MALELHFTSVPKGLLPGTSGFCTVGATSGMSTLMMQRLESLSGYRPLYQVGGPDENRNPVSYAHWRADIGGRLYSVLSRVGSAGVDYTRRSNKYAHHVVLDAPEQAPAGPAWVMMRPGVMGGSWAGAPRTLEPRRLNLPHDTNPPRVCETWAKATGDAGWAGVLVDNFLRDASRPAYILYPPGTDLLPLIDEAIALLAEATRWRVTFNTFFTDLPAGLSCSWRCCVAGTPAAQQASSRATGGVVIDLTKPMGHAPDSRYVVAARTGQSVAQEQTVAVSPQVEHPPPVSAAVEIAPTPDSQTRQSTRTLRLLDDLTAAHGHHGLTGAGAYMRGRYRIRRLFWAVAIGWPILVAGLTGALLHVWRDADKAKLAESVPLKRIKVGEPSEHKWGEKLAIASAGLPDGWSATHAGREGIEVRNNTTKEVILVKLDNKQISAKQLAPPQDKLRLPDTRSSTQESSTGGGDSQKTQGPPRGVQEPGGGTPDWVPSLRGGEKVGSPKTPSIFFVPTTSGGSERPASPPAGDNSKQTRDDKNGQPDAANPNTPQVPPAPTPQEDTSNKDGALSGDSSGSSNRPASGEKAPKPKENRQPTSSPKRTSSQPSEPVVFHFLVTRDDKVVGVLEVEVEK